MKRGFSLLEVMIATAILAVVFAYVSGALIQGGFLQAKAPLYTQSALLVRGVVLDLEEEYKAEGFPETDEEGRDCELPREAGQDYTCTYDLERLELEEADLGEMAATLMEQMMGGVGEQGSILQTFQVLNFLFVQGNVPVSPGCPATPGELLNMCQINLQLIEQNIMGMITFFPRIIMMAAKQTRKLRVKIYHTKLGKEPVLEVETFIVSIPEELRMLGRSGAIGDPNAGGTTPAQPGTTGTTGQPVRPGVQPVSPGRNP